MHRGSGTSLRQPGTGSPLHGRPRARRLTSRSGRMILPGLMIWLMVGLLGLR